MNASLDFRQNNPEDLKFMEFCNRNNLQTQQRGTSTFHYVNEKNKAQTDYMLFQPSTQDIVRPVKLETHTDINTSDNIPVTMLEVATIDVKSVLVRVKPKWDKCNIPLYYSYILSQLQPFTCNSPQTD